MAGVLFHQFRRDHQVAHEQSLELMRLSLENGFVLYEAEATICLGLALAQKGQFEEGIAQMRQGFTAFQATGAQLQRSRMLGWLAEAYGKAGRAEEGLSMLAEALALVQELGERYYEAEIHRLQGDLLLMEGHQAGAESSFRHAIDVARRQQAKSWELRATTSLARLWQEQGRSEEARKVLAGILGWFAEGFSTVDLVEAGALLDELS
jgi:predicted ATPase